MLRVGIIGSGFGLYGLLPAFNSTRRCKVVSICGEKTDRLVSYCQSIGLTNIYTDWQIMLDNEKLDVIAIAVPPNVQYQVAKVAINKGLHIFAEKPLAVTYTEANELLNLAKRKKIIHVIDFIFPEIKQWQEVKKLIDSKIYGGLKHINTNWDFLSFDIRNKKSSWKVDVKMGGGALSFYFSHCLYYLRYFAGEILTFKSSLSYSKESLKGGEVGVDLLLQFQSGTTGYAHLNCNVRGLNRHQLLFVFEKGTIVLENENNITSNFVIKLYTDNGVKQLFLVKEKEVKNDEDERVRVVKKLIARFIDAIIHKKEVTPSFNDGVRVQQLIEKIRKEAIS